MKRHRYEFYLAGKENPRNGCAHRSNSATCVFSMRQLQTVVLVAVTNPRLSDGQQSTQLDSWRPHHPEYTLQVRKRKVTCLQSLKET